MPDTDTDTDAFDAQDVAEAYDETLTDGDETDSDALDLRRDTYDAVTALGDGDVEGDDDEMDAADETDDDLQEIAELADQQDEDDLDDGNSDKDPLAVDDIPDRTNDRDFIDARRRGRRLRPPLRRAHRDQHGRRGRAGRRARRAGGRHGIGLPVRLRPRRTRLQGGVTWPTIVTTAS